MNAEGQKKEREEAKQWLQDHRPYAGVDYVLGFIQGWLERAKRDLKYSKLVEAVSRIEEIADGYPPDTIDYLLIKDICEKVLEEVKG